MKRIKRTRRKSQALVNDLIYFYLHFGALCEYTRGGINMEISKPHLESIINLLIHKHEIKIKYINKARKAKKSEEQQEKSCVRLKPICVVYFTFLFPRSLFCTPHKRK
jgi:hypothetical protein